MFFWPKRPSTVASGLNSLMLSHLGSTRTGIFPDLQALSIPNLSETLTPSIPSTAHGAVMDHFAKGNPSANRQGRLDFQHQDFPEIGAKQSYGHAAGHFSGPLDHDEVRAEVGRGFSHSGGSPIDGIGTEECAGSLDAFFCPFHGRLIGIQG